ncbi:MAG TPA: hypothetical protein VNA25_23205 [Phycisphaerae bacterium]|nr:hypothetical protein [Phycisphaerae bacterium]
MKRKMILTLLCLAALAASSLLAGCTVVTQDQKDWIRDKANRSGAFVALMDKSETDRSQEQAWIRSQDESWRLWSQKIDLGLAAPNWLADAKKQAVVNPNVGAQTTTQPATQPAWTRPDPAEEDSNP